MADRRIITLAEFKQRYSDKGFSVMEIAYSAQFVKDDVKFSDAAKAAVMAEDNFLEMMHDREIYVG